MSHPLCSVQNFEIVAPHTLRISLDDATDQIIDFKPVLRVKLHGPLRDVRLFNRVAIDMEAHTLVWPNGADVNPETLHQGPHCKAAFIQRDRFVKHYPFSQQLTT